jgi:hypothetical protein
VPGQRAPRDLVEVEQLRGDAADLDAMDVASARRGIGFHVRALECGDDTPDGVLDDLARAGGRSRDRACHQQPRHESLAHGPRLPAGREREHLLCHRPPPG